MTIRFDTLLLPRRRARGAEAVPDGSEIIDARWFEPARALEGSEAGELLMVFPTIKNLEELRPLRERRRAARVGVDPEVVPIEPRVVMEGEVARVVLPGEPGYEA